MTRSAPPGRGLCRGSLGAGALQGSLVASMLNLQRQLHPILLGVLAAGASAFGFVGDGGLSRFDEFLQP